jgi:hypothetical protein
MRFWIPVVLLYVLTLPIYAQDDALDGPSAVKIRLLESVATQDAASPRVQRICCGRP